MLDREACSFSMVLAASTGTRHDGYLLCSRRGCHDGVFPISASVSVASSVFAPEVYYSYRQSSRIESYTYSTEEEILLVVQAQGKYTGPAPSKNVT